MLPDLTGPRRVLMTTDAVGGVWRYALDLAATLQDRELTTVLAGLGPKPSPAQVREAEAAGVALRWLDVELDWTVVRAGALGTLPSVLAETASDVKADLLHLNAPAQAADLKVEQPVVVAAHSCVATWWQAVKSGPLPEDWTWRRDMNRSGFDAADIVLAPSASYADDLRAVYGDIPRIAVAHNGTAPRAAETPKREVIVAVGRWWDEAKNMALLDRAAGAVDWPVEAIGSLAGPHGVQAPVPSAVRALGPLDAAVAAERIGSAAIFVSPALYEPFGLGVLEAAGGGAALVLSDIATFRELWDGAALFVDPRAPESIAGGLNRVARDPALRATLARAARERAQSYSLEAQADRVLSAYAEAFASRARSALALGTA